MQFNYTGCDLPVTGQSKVRLVPGRILTCPPTVALKLRLSNIPWSETFLHDTAMAGCSGLKHRENIAVAHAIVKFHTLCKMIVAWVKKLTYACSN